VAVDLAAVCSQLGTETESVEELSLADLATGSFDPHSVLILVGPGGLPLIGWAASKAAERNPLANLAWGLPDGAFAHRPWSRRPSCAPSCSASCSCHAPACSGMSAPAAPSASNRHSCALG